MSYNAAQMFKMYSYLNCGWNWNKTAAEKTLSASVFCLMCQDSFIVNHLGACLDSPLPVIRFSVFFCSKKTKQGSGTCLLMLIYLLIFPPYFFKARLAPRFPKYVHVVNPVSLIHPLPPSNLSSTHISFLSAQGYSMIHSLHQTLSHSI